MGKELLSVGAWVLDIFLIVNELQTIVSYSVGTGLVGFRG